MEEERTENECCEAPECPVMHSNRGAISIEVILVLVGICIADKSRILCGNFRCI